VLLTPPAAEVVYVPTHDGARVAVKRRPTPGGPPVIFIHGLAVNADLWDLPDVEGRDFHYRSLASLLHDAHYDIWLMNLRGHGAPRMLSQPPPGQSDWCIDHFILFDLPAVVAHVRAATDQRPFIIGASMGAMTLAGYVQGAQLIGDTPATRDTFAPDPVDTARAADPQLAPATAPHIVADPALARSRQEHLAGAIFVEFPAALRWPQSLYGAGGRLRLRALLRDFWRTDGDVNYAFEILARWGWLHALLAAAGQVPLSIFVPSGERGPWYNRLPAVFAGQIAKVERVAIQAMLSVAGTFTGATHHRAEVMLAGHRYILDHMKAGVLRQLAKCVRAGAFVSDTGTPDHVYSNHYDTVALPTLVVQGGRDRIANADVTRTTFFDVIPAADKQFLLYPEIAHGELEAAPYASMHVYPAICEWLAARVQRAVAISQPAG
jgi:pimeloyl-ACP methyl ester carboxylesterase